LLEDAGDGGGEDADDPDNSEDVVGDLDAFGKRIDNIVCSIGKSLE
jgi:hypothetical protein